MKTTKEIREVLIPAMALAGHTHQQIADHYNINRAYVSRLIRSYDKKTGHKKTKELGIRRDIMTLDRLIESLESECLTKKEVKLLSRYCRRFYKLGYQAGKELRYRRQRGGKGSE